MSVCSDLLWWWFIPNHLSEMTINYKRMLLTSERKRADEDTFRRSGRANDE